MAQKTSSTADSSFVARNRRAVWTVLVVVIIAATIVKPALGVILAVLWLVFLLFRRVDLDATTVLTIFLVFLTLVPARYVVPALGAAGTPAAVIALGSGYWWLLERVAPREAVVATNHEAPSSPCGLRWPCSGSRSRRRSSSPSLDRCCRSSRTVPLGI